MTDQSKDARQVSEEIAELVRGYYESGVAELEQVHAEFNEKVAARREAVDKVSELEGRLSENSARMQAADSAAWKADLDDDEGSKRSAKKEYKAASKEREKLQKDLDNARAKADGFDEVQASRELSRRAEEIKSRYAPSLNFHVRLREAEQPANHQLYEVAAKLGREQAAREKPTGEDARYVQGQLAARRGEELAAARGELEQVEAELADLEPRLQKETEAATQSAWSNMGTGGVGTADPALRQTAAATEQRVQYLKKRRLALNTTIGKIEKGVD